MKTPTMTDTVARLQREAEDAAGLEPLPEFPEPETEGYATIAEAEAALRASKAPATYHADADGSNVRPSERCGTPSMLGISCVSRAFHAGAHSWDMTGLDQTPAAADMLPGMPEPASHEAPEPEPDDYDTPFEAQFNKLDFKAAPGLKVVAERLISETQEFAHLREINIRYFWKRRGGLKGGNPRYGALTRPSGLAGYALGMPVYALWLAADHIREAKWIPRQFDAQIFDLLAHSAVDPDDHSAYRILGDDFAGMSLTLERFGMWNLDLREAGARLRQLAMEDEIALPTDADDELIEAEPDFQGGVDMADESAE